MPPPPGRKAFTLFTALVAVILIVLSLLLVYSMMRTESNTTDIMNDIRQQDEMQAIADLARADSLQVFNYGMRLVIEDWLTEESTEPGIPQNDYLMRQGLTGWEDIKKDFVKNTFGVEGQGTQLATRAATHLSSLLAKSEDVMGYDVDLDKPDEALLMLSMKEIFDKSSARGEFLEVIQCPDGEFDNCLGTFYINLNLGEEYLSNEKYEKLPQLRVENRNTKKVIKQPILPRGNLQIYIPLRIFKAIAAAKELAHTPGEAGIYDLPGRTGSFFENINSLQLGYCNPSDCTVIGPPGTDADTAKDAQSLRTKLNDDARDVLNARFEQLAAALNLESDSSFELKGTGIRKLKKGLTTSDVKHTKYLPDNTKLYCAKIDGTEATVVFEEKNPKYQVVGNRPHLYGIRLYDNRYEEIEVGSIDYC